VAKNSRLGKHQHFECGTRRGASAESEQAQRKERTSVSYDRIWEPHSLTLHPAREQSL
jgi:hypothetical protein